MKPFPEFKKQRSYSSQQAEEGRQMLHDLFGEGYSDIADEWLYSIEERARETNVSYYNRLWNKVDWVCATIEVAQDYPEEFAHWWALRRLTS